MDLFTYLMAKNGHNTSIHEDLFSYLLGKAQGGGGEIKTATGITINIPDAKKLVSFMMTKESTQETTTGKNLLVPITSRTSQKNGIDFTYDEETQLYTLNGTCTSDDTSFPIMSNTINFINRTTKILAYYISGSAENSCDLQFFQTNYQSGESFSLINLNQQNPIVSKISAHDGNYLASLSRIKFKSGSIVNNFKFKIMVTNDDDTNYEPYTNGASPNPDYTQEVKTVKGYRNLFDKDNVNKLNAQIGDNNVILNSNNAKSLYIAIKENASYTITKIAGQRFRAGTTSSIPQIGTTVSNFIKSDYETKINITSNIGDNYLVVYYYNSLVDTLTEQEILNSIQIVEGDQELPYVPYGNNYVNVAVSDGNTTNNYPIPLMGNEIAGIEDYLDEYVVDKDGHCYLNKLMGKRVLNGSENWVIHSSNVNRTVFTTPIVGIENYIDSSAIPNLLCSHFISVSENSTWKVGDISRTRTFNKNFIYLIVNPNMTVEDFKTWLSTHNTDVYYVLETPELIDLQTTVDLSLFKGVNNVSNSEDGYMTIEYVSENKEA